MQLIFRHLNKKFALSLVSWGLSVVQDLGVASADVRTRGSKRQSQGERPQWSRGAEEINKNSFSCGHHQFRFI